MAPLNAPPKVIPTGDSLRKLAEDGRMINQTAGPWKNAIEFDEAVSERTRQAMIASGMWDRSLPDGGLRAVIHKSLALALWDRYGSNIFRLSPHLGAAMTLTTPPPFDPESFKLPYPAFAVMLPPGVVPFWLAPGQQVWAEYLFLSVYEVPRYPTAPWEKLVWVPMVRFSANYGDGELWRQLALADFANTTLVQDQEEETMYSERVVRSAASMSFPQLPEDEVTLRATVHILRNAVSWINSCGGGQREHLPASARRPPKGVPAVEPPVWGLGREVRLRPELLQTAAEEAVGRSRQAVRGWHIRSRFVVRGHFWPRDPAQIPKRGCRRWVAPYWRGPEGAEAWQHVYTDK